MLILILTKKSHDEREKIKKRLLEIGAIIVLFNNNSVNKVSVELPYELTEKFLIF